MEKLTEILKKIGLKEEEIKIYLACLEQGTTSILELSKKTRIPRATIYLIIESLIKRGLLEQTVVGKRKRLVASEPGKLLRMAEGKKENLESAIEELRTNLPQLLAIYNLKVAKPKVRYYHGVDGIKEIYEDSLNYQEILVECMTQEGIRIMGDYLKKYFKRVLRRGIKTKEIVSSTRLDKEYQGNQATSRNEIICIPNKYITNTDYFLYGNKIALITYKGGQPIGILIEDQELASFEKTHFEILWQAAKRDIL